MSDTLAPPPPVHHDVPHQVPPPRRPDHEGPSRVVLGVVLMLLGVGWLADAVGLIDLSWQTMLSVALVGVGATLLATSRRGGHAGLITLGVVLSVLLVSSHITPTTFGLDEVSDRSVHPTALTELQPAYDLGAGALTLDLRDLTLPAGETPVDIDVGMGEIVVRLPDGAAADVQATVGMGEAQILGQSRGGMGVEVQQLIDGSEGAGTLVLTLSVGMGTIEVTR